MRIFCCYLCTKINRNKNILKTKNKHSLLSTVAFCIIYGTKETNSAESCLFYKESNKKYCLEGVKFDIVICLLISLLQYIKNKLFMPK